MPLAVVLYTVHFRFQGMFDMELYFRFLFMDLSDISRQLLAAILNMLNIAAGSPGKLKWQAVDPTT